MSQTEIKLLHESETWYVFLYRGGFKEFVMLINKRDFENPTEAYDFNVGEFLTPEGLLNLKNNSFLANKVREYLSSKQEKG